jgi:hypothetical protein
MALAPFAAREVTPTAVHRASVQGTPASARKREGAARLHSGSGTAEPPLHILAVMSHLYD